MDKIFYRALYPDGSVEDTELTVYDPESSNPNDIIAFKRCTYYTDRYGIMLYEGDYIKGHEGTDQPVDGVITWDDVIGCWRVNGVLLWKHHASSCHLFFENTNEPV